MKNYWIIGSVVLTVYFLSLGIVTYYFSVPSSDEKSSVMVTSRLVDTNPISDEFARSIKGREKYGDWPIDVKTERLGKFNPFRLQ